MKNLEEDMMKYWNACNTSTVCSDIIMRPCAQKSVRAFCRSLATSMWSLFDDQFMFI